MEKSKITELPKVGSKTDKEEEPIVEKKKRVPIVKKSKIEDKSE